MKDCCADHTEVTLPRCGCNILPALKQSNCFNIVSVLVVLCCGYEYDKFSYRSFNYTALCFYGSYTNQSIWPRGMSITRPISHLHGGKFSSRTRTMTFTAIFLFLSIHFLRVCNVEIYSRLQRFQNNNWIRCTSVQRVPIAMLISFSWGGSSIGPWVKKCPG